MQCTRVSTLWMPTSSTLPSIRASIASPVFDGGDSVQRFSTGAAIATFVVTATTKVAIAAPVEKRCTESPPSKTGLAMLARIDGSVLEVGIHNVDTRVHCIAGYIHTFEQQS